MQTVADWFVALYRSTGVNLTVFYDAFDRSRFIRGVAVSLELMCICVAMSVVIGIVGAWAQRSQIASLRRLIGAYIQLFRNTPPIVQLYFFYFGLGSYITWQMADGTAKPIVSAFTWAVICLSIYGGAFNVEILRAGIEAVPRATIEAATTLGFTRFQAYRHIVLPLAFRISLPALTNNLVNVIKTTTVAYAISVPEMLYVSSQIWSDNLNVPEMMNLLLLIYLALIGLFVYGMARVERTLRVPGIGV